MPPAYYPLGVTSDSNGDSIPEVIIEVLLSSPAGNYEWVRFLAFVEGQYTEVHHVAGGNPTWDSGDPDDDDLVELMVGGVGVAFIEQTAAGAYPDYLHPVTPFISEGMGWPIFASFDHDTAWDVFWGEQWLSAPGRIRWYEFDQGMLVLRETFGGDYYYFGSCQKVCIDIDSDGRNELIAPEDHGLLLIWQSPQDDEVFLELQHPLPGGWYDYVAVGDIDGDSRPELVISGSTFDNDFVLHFFESDAPGEYIETCRILHDDPYMGRAALAISDIDNDGRLELAAGFHDICFFKSDGDNSYYLWKRIPREALGPGWVWSFQIVDMDKNGLRDIFVVNEGIWAADLAYKSHIFEFVPSPTPSVSPPPPSPSPTESPTPTRRPSATGTPRRSPTARLRTPSPSPTSDRPLGVRLELATRMVHPGETFWVRGYVDRPASSGVTGAGLFFVLQVGAEFFFWPSWSSWSSEGGGEIDFRRLELPRGTLRLDVVPPFTWPDTGASRGEGLVFYGALLDPGLEVVLGGMAVETWGYGPEEGD
jgi:hypothetical protein